MLNVYFFRCKQKKVSNNEQNEAALRNKDQEIIQLKQV